jgi:hypothetical protein
MVQEGEEMLDLNISPVFKIFFLEDPVDFFPQRGIFLEEMVRLLETAVATLA